MANDKTIITWQMIRTMASNKTITMWKIIRPTSIRIVTKVKINVSKPVRQ